MVQRGPLGVLSIVLMNIAAILSLRNLPLLAPYGLGMIFFYAIAALGFFIPVALISAELASLMPEEGGLYAWLRAAFGECIAFFGVWISLITTVTALTMTLVFIAGAVAYGLSPALAASRPFSCLAIVVLTWGATAISLKGMALSARVTGLATVFGTCIPGCLIAVLGLIWLFSGQPSGMPASSILPKLNNLANLSFLSGVLFAFSGLEMSAYHVLDVANPGRSYPRAIFLSTLSILTLSVLGSLAIATIVPASELRLEVGVVQALTLGLRRVHLGWLAPVVGFCIAFGGIAYVFAWMAGPSRGLLATRTSGVLPPWLQRTNGHGMPVAILLCQAAVITVCAMLFLCVPTISLGFWALNAVSAVLMLAMYLFLFLAGPILRVKMPTAHRSYRIPFGRWGMAAASLAGLASASFSIVLAFILPTELFGTMSSDRFFATVLAGTLLLGAPPFLFYALRRPAWRPSN